MEDEELDVWIEDLVIQVLILLLEVSKIIWKLKWLNSELKQARMRLWMSTLESPSIKLKFSTLLL